VAFVYDVLDTEGDGLPADVAQTFHATGQIIEGGLLGLISRLGKRGINDRRIPYGDANAGHVVFRRSADKKIRPGY